LSGRRPLEYLGDALHAHEDLHGHNHEHELRLVDLCVQLADQGDPRCHVAQQEQDQEEDEKEQHPLDVGVDVRCD